ncbi:MULTISPECIES: hypothetical protein [unclassified Campylobacter]|uniref:hypothetical protein n=1 Tax=unclassified Campylobacter TaxID=2593542 RepID=UPI00147611D1|nr:MULTISPECIES: hypothetical protein [unclassified Campylobacter]
MQIQNIQKQISALGRAYTKSYDELFSNYVKKTNSESNQEIQTRLANEFYKEQKELQKVYEAKKYELYIQEVPSMHTMIHVVNYKQKIMIDEMNFKLKEAYQELKNNLTSGRYNAMEKLELKAKYREFKQNLKDETFKEIDKFSASYQDALVSRDNSRIDQLENSLLTNLLSKI